jgi:hypothetical protein
MTPRRFSSLLAAGLLATALPIVASSPAAANTPCTSTFSEVHDTSVPLGATGCDDITPPQTAISAVEPTPTVLGYTRSTTVTFTFAGAYTDADAGPISLECQMYDTAAAPTDWTACTSPKTYTNLADTTTTPYTFRVRAIDDDDKAIAACDGTYEALDVLCAGEESVEDVDATPATATINVDTVAPNTFLTKAPVDTITPDRPVVLTASPTVELNSSEPAGFACTLNGKSFTPCTKGIVTVANLKGGTYTFLARAYDAAFNLDPTPVSTTFTVPTNIKKTKKSGWKKVRDAALIGADYVTATKVGQTLTLSSVKKVQEVRLIAPTGPTFGKIEVRVGTSQWYTVNLHSAKPHAMTQLLVRDEYSLPQSGPIRIRVKELGGSKTSVRLDAIVAR